MTPPTFYDDILTEEEKEFLSRWLKNWESMKKYDGSV
jgi:hypothetical protein